jgi:hypothetical protein
VPACSCCMRRGLGLRLGRPSRSAAASPLCCAPPRPAAAAGLAQLAEESGAYIQSHISESCAEAELVRSLHPEAQNDAQVFQAMGLLTSKVRGTACIAVLYCIASVPACWGRARGPRGPTRPDAVVARQAAAEGLGGWR